MSEEKTDTERILAALMLIEHPCNRSELAGVAEMTIRQISEPLQDLVRRGRVRRLKDGRYTLRARSLRRTIQRCIM